MEIDNILEARQIINADIDKVWLCFTDPLHIVNWCFASEDWQASNAKNDLFSGGKFVTTMSAKDGSNSFDFGGMYENVEDKKILEYVLDDSRRVKVIFTDLGDNVEVTEFFEAEEVNTKDKQVSGWQAILDNFKKYVESRI